MSSQSKCDFACLKACCYTRTSIFFVRALEDTLCVNVCRSYFVDHAAFSKLILVLNVTTMIATFKTSFLFRSTVAQKQIGCIITKTSGCLERPFDNLIHDDDFMMIIDVSLNFEMLYLLHCNRNERTFLSKELC